MYLMMPLLATFGLGQEALPRPFTLFHNHAPVSTEIRSVVRCNSLQPIAINFVAERRGVSMESPRFPRIGETDHDFTEIRGRLREIGNLRDWKVACRGDSALLIFRGGDRGADGPADMIVLEIWDGVVVDAPDPATVRYLYGAE